MKDIHEVVERSFGDILDFINSGVYVTDTDRRIVFWNKTAEQITGYSAAEVVGRRCRDNVLEHQDRHGQPLCTTDLCPLYRAIVRATPSDAPVVVYAKSKSGQRLPLSTSVGPVLSEDGSVIGGVEVFRDERQNIREMELAQVLQRQMVTATPPEDDRLAFSIQYAPRELIGGDFCHLRRISPGQCVVFVGDAAGHGTSAALYSGLIYSLIMECEDLLTDPAALMRAINRRACNRATGLGFFTAVCARLDAAGPTVTYCLAGHPPPLLRRAEGGAVERLSLAHLPVGTHEDADYENGTADVRTGDRLLFYTDGATDVRTGAEERLGTGGLSELLADSSRAGDHWVRHLYEALMERCATVEPDDDITLVGCLLR
jgi:PAS domain S-box-containing protein